jgi:acyl-CoA thioesterase
MSGNTEEPHHPFADLLGFEITEKGDGVCQAVLQITDEHRNPHGVVHGAVIYALVDTSMGGALVSVMEESEICSTIEIKINYMRPALTGNIHCVTSVINKTRRTGVMESDVYDDKERLLAKSLGTFMISLRPD